MHRRTILGFLLSVVSSGCLSVFEDKQTRLVEVQYGNYDHQPHTFFLQIKRDGKTVHERTVQLAEYHEDSPVDGDVIDEGLPQNPGQYTIIARIENDTARATLDEGGRENNCTRVLITIEPRDLGIFSTTECQTQSNSTNNTQ